MSLLAPLYFFGAFAIGLPILFHLIRRRPKGEVEFSSLMFLRPTPPRLTRKSRLDNWPLLLIRALALILLAAAFMRPFWRSATLSDDDLPSRRMIVLLDTSASMQRPGLWQQAQDEAEGIIDDLQRADQLAIVTFDREPTILLGFEQSDRLDVSQRKKTAKSLLAGVKPTWHATDTGRAMSFAADLAVTYEPESTVEGESSEESVANPLAAPPHMILISDMQAGSEIEKLQVYAWPDNLRLDVKQVVAKDKTNASAQILNESVSDSDEPDDKNRVRVRVANSADATESRFRIAWDGGPTSVELPVQVPPGESRVVRMPLPEPGVKSLVLSGDDVSFDNTRYVVSPQPESMTLLHLTAKPAVDARQSLLYYLQRVPLSNRRRDVAVQTRRFDELQEVPDAKQTPLIVVEGPYSSDVAEKLKEYAAAGGGLLHVLTSDQRFADVATSLNLLIQTDENESSLQIEEADVSDYAMFSRIDFTHPVFAPMADPQFNDFTKIRIWSHRKISGVDESWNTLCTFDNDSPALIEKPIGDGRVWVLATGWQPSESQFALSTKFIPFLFSLFDTQGGKGAGDRFVIGEKIDLTPSETTTITGPNGSAFEFRASEDLSAIDEPGIYHLVEGETHRSFAINLSEAESRTDPLSETELERFGVTLGKQLSTTEVQAQQRQLRDIELEGRQRLWQWLLLAVLALLALETLLGGLISRGRRDYDPGLET